jgi:hypothetical protein
MAAVKFSEHVACVTGLHLGLPRSTTLVRLFARVPSPSRKKITLISNNAHLKGEFSFSFTLELFYSFLVRMLKRRRSLFPFILISLAIPGFGQPSPSLQKRISQAIAAAANDSHPDYTAFVNPFIGTGKFCPL